MSHVQAGVHETIVQFMRLMNKLQKLEGQPRDLGTGDLLYPAEVHLLEAVGEKPDITATEISRQLGITRGAISQSIAKLSRKGYLRQQRNPSYVKEILLSLTGKGQTAFQEHQRFHAKMEEGFMEYIQRFSPEQVAGFKDLLNNIEALADHYLK